MLKTLIPLRYRVRLRTYLNRQQQERDAQTAAALVRDPPLPLPPGETEESLRDLLSTLQVGGKEIPAEELAAFRSHLKRFVHTLALVPDGPLRALELGADPYCLTVLIKLFRPQATLTLANGPAPPGSEWTHRVSVNGSTFDFVSQGFNGECEPFPYPDDSFDLVTFCEMIEHLPNDPVYTLTEIKRVLAPGGRLILTTPHAGRLENVCRIVAGENVADQYSGYGVYGRHNREFTLEEVVQLLTANGFTVEKAYTANVHEDWTPRFKGLHRLRPLLNGKRELGQYQFSRSYVTEESKRMSPVRPEWLYRSLGG